MAENFYKDWGSIVLNGQQLITKDKTYSLNQIGRVSKHADTTGVSLKIPLILAVLGIITLFTALL